MLKLTLVFAVLLCAVAVYGQTTPFSRCGDQRPPQALSFNGCKSPQQFCQVQRGGNVLSRMRFTPSREVRRLQAYAHLRIDGRFIVWPLNLHSNACNYLLNDAQCPLRANTAYTYELRAKFPTAQVPLNQTFHVFFTVRDEDRRDVLSCFRTLVSVSR